jgi:hypothetical protein
MVIFSLKKDAIQQLTISEIHTILDKWIENGYLLHNNIYVSIKEKIGNRPFAKKLKFCMEYSKNISNIDDIINHSCCVWDPFQLFDSYGISEDYEELVNYGYGYIIALKELFIRYKNKYNELYLKSTEKFEDICEIFSPFILTSSNIYVIDNYCFCKNNIKLLTSFMETIKDIIERIGTGKKYISILSANSRDEVIGAAKHIYERFADSMNLHIYIAPHDEDTKKHAHFRSIIFDKREFVIDRGILGLDSQYASKLNYCMITEWSNYVSIIKYYEKRNEFTP